MLSVQITDNGPGCVFFFITYIKASSVFALYCCIVLQIEHVFECFVMPLVNAVFLYLGSMEEGAIFSRWSFSYLHKGPASSALMKHLDVTTGLSLAEAAKFSLKELPRVTYAHRHNKSHFNTP